MAVGLVLTLGRILVTSVGVDRIKADAEVRIEKPIAAAAVAEIPNIIKAIKVANIIKVAHQGEGLLQELVFKL